MGNTYRNKRYRRVKRTAEALNRELAYYRPTQQRLEAKRIAEASFNDWLDWRDTRWRQRDSERE